MPHPLGIYPANEDERLNFRLWIGVLMPPIAGGINTVVSYIVSNYDCSVHNRHLVLLVNLITLLLCGLSMLIAAPVGGRFDHAPDSSSSLLHTRRFMLCMSYWFSLGFALFILAGTTSTFLLKPCDL